MGCCTSLVSPSAHHFRSLVYVSPVEADFPEPTVPKTRLEDIFRRQNYASIEKHAIKAPAHLLRGSLPHLTRHLCKPATDDVGRLWAIYVWVTSQDPETAAHTPGDPPRDNTPLDYLIKINMGLLNHAHLFAALVRPLLMPCVVIGGVTKNAHYVVGDEISSSSKMAAQWNAVYVCGSWRLVDSYWGGYFVRGRRPGSWSIVSVDGETVTEREADTQGKPHRTLNPFFFLTDPDQLVATHLPGEPRWQLLPRPVTSRQFADTVYIREQFFHMSLQLLPESHVGACVKTKDGAVVASFGIPPERVTDFDFKFLLYKDTARCSHLDNNTLDGIVMYERQLDVLKYSLEFPVSGRFRFDILGADSASQEQFDLVCSYLIDCDRPSKTFQRLPVCPEIGWGPGVAARRAGLVATSHQEAVIQTREGSFQIRFKLKDQVSAAAELRHNELCPWRLRQHVVVWTDSDELLVEVRLPVAGQYAVMLYTRSQTENQLAGDMDNVCNYLVRYNQPDIPARQTPSNYPPLHDGMLGGHPDTSRVFGVKILCHLAGLIDTATPEVVVRFSCSRPGVTLLGELRGGKPGSDDSIEKCVALHADEQGAVFTLALPDEGEYSFSVYCRYDKELQTLHPVHRHLIRYTKSGQKEAAPCHKHGESEEILTAECQVTAGPIAGAECDTLASYSKLLTVTPADDVSLATHGDEAGVRFDVPLPVVSRYLADVFRWLQDGSVLHKKTFQIDRREVLPPVQPPSEVAAGTADDSGSTRTSQRRRQLDNRPSLAGFNSVVTQKLVTKDLNDSNVKTTLKIAVALGKYHLLRKAMGRYKRRELDDPELFRRAKSALKKLQIEKDLMTGLRIAMATGATTAMEKALNAAEKEGLQKELGLKMAVCRRMLVKTLGDNIRKMNQATVAEVKSYSAPPLAAINVMRASLLLLGHTKAEVKDWDSMRVVIGDTQKMKQRLQAVNTENIPLEVLVEARDLLSGYNHEEIRKVSEVLAAFFAWSDNLVKLKTSKTPEP